MPTIEEVLKLCREITEVDLLHKTIFELLTGGMEEWGELCRAVHAESNTFGNLNKTNDEPAKNEAADVVISALAAYFATGGTLEELPDIMLCKLSKWQKNQSAAIEKKFQELTEQTATPADKEELE